MCKTTLLHLDTFLQLLVKVLVGYQYIRLEGWKGLSVSPWRTNSGLGDFLVLRSSSRLKERIYEI
jgi:hypothetical protein